MFARTVHTTHLLKLSRSSLTQYLRDTRIFELKRSFRGLYSHFSRELAGEMMSITSMSILAGGVHYFASCEREFLRDLVVRIEFEVR